MSIALQSVKPSELIIVDDSDLPVNLTEIPHYRYIFQLLDEYQVKWIVLFGAKKGQHISHQTIQMTAKNDLIFRIDDDEVAEPDVIEKLLLCMKDPKVGAAAPLVLHPNPAFLPEGLKNTIEGISNPNVQWFKPHVSSSCIHEAEHLTSSFMYRKGIVDYEIGLSCVAHREETIFTHSIYRKGYKLQINNSAIVRHFRQDKGGIRSTNIEANYTHDEAVFQSLLNRWGFTSDSDTKWVVLDSGLGDHYAFKNILPKLRKKYNKIIIAACYPDVFHDERPGLKLVSIAEALLHHGSIDHFNIYRFMTESHWKKTLSQAFEKFYLT